jgi:hypothetical protein
MNNVFFKSTGLEAIEEEETLTSSYCLGQLISKPLKDKWPAI